MKKTLLFALISGLALCSSAQLVVLPRGQLVAGKETSADICGKTLRKDRVWYFDCGHGDVLSDSLSYTHVRVSYVGDTLVNGMEYMKYCIESDEFGTFDPQYTLILREDNGKIYRNFEKILHRFQGGSQIEYDKEYLLYDLSADDGQTYETGLEHNCFEMWDEAQSENITVIKRETISVNGEDLTRLTLRSDYTESEFQIIEGIGPVSDGFVGYLLANLVPTGAWYYVIGFNRMEDKDGNVIYRAKDIGFAGIDAVNTNNSVNDDRTYDLMGHELRGEPQRGTVYIRNGRKEIAR